MASTTQRGYGWAHQQLRAALLATYSPAAPCWRCCLPLGPYPELLDLGHIDGDKTRYAGLEHRRCSRSAGAKRGNQLRGHDGTTTRRRRRGNVRWTPYGFRPADDDVPRSRRSRNW
jgi:hypothetical protein